MTSSFTPRTATLGRTALMADSPRYCATHKTHGDHHTDRCPLTFDPSPEAAARQMLADARRLARTHKPVTPAPVSRWARLVRRFTRHSVA